MTPTEAEEVFYELGDVLTNQWLTRPEKFGPHLRCLSRAGLRKAILMWVAKQKFDGMDILLRRQMAVGKPVAVLELAQQIWPWTSVFGPLQDGRPAFESREESAEAARRRDAFVDFLQTLDTEDPHYWQKVEAQLA